MTKVQKYEKNDGELEQWQHYDQNVTKKSSGSAETWLLIFATQEAPNHNELFQYTICCTMNTIKKKLTIYKTGLLSYATQLLFFSTNKASLSPLLHTSTIHKCLGRFWRVIIIKCFLKFWINWLMGKNQSQNWRKCS